MLFSAELSQSIFNRLAFISHQPGNCFQKPNVPESQTLWNLIDTFHQILCLSILDQVMPIKILIWLCHFKLCYQIYLPNLFQKNYFSCTNVQQVEIINHIFFNISLALKLYKLCRYGMYIYAFIINICRAISTDYFLW